MRRNTLTAIFLAAFTALTLPATADAQTRRPEHGRMMGQHRMAGPGHDPATRILALRRELALTEAQIDQIGRIRTTLEERNAPLLAQLSAAHEQMRAERQQVTPEQREEMRAEMQERRAEMQERRADMQERRQAMRERRAAMRDSVERMTPEQREQMRARMQERAGRVRQRAGAAARPGIPDELRPAVEQLQSNTREAMQQIQAVLTDEQRQKLQELRSVQGHRRPAVQRMRRGAGEQGARPGTPRRLQGAAPGSR